MGKKICGFILFALAAFIVIKGVADGTLFVDLGSGAATFGNLCGKIIPIVLFIFSGIYLFTFDSPTKMAYIDGFKNRSKQASKCMVFIVAYGILFMITCAVVALSCPDNYMLSLIIATIPYMVPLGIFVYLYLAYSLPHNASVKYFVSNEEALNEYLAASETFRAYSEDNAVMASGKALYFPQLFCVIPFSQITSTKLVKDLWAKNVYFNLSNGKKICILTKHNDHILAAIKEHSEANN